LSAPSKSLRQWHKFIRSHHHCNQKRTPRNRHTPDAHQPGPGLATPLHAPCTANTTARHRTSQPHQHAVAPDEGKDATGHRSEQSSSARWATSPRPDASTAAQPASSQPPPPSTADHRQSPELDDSCRRLPLQVPLAGGQQLGNKVPPPPDLNRRWTAEMVAAYAMLRASSRLSDAPWRRLPRRARRRWHEATRDALFHVPYNLERGKETKKN
jgi:hypothetical protein